MAEDSTGKKGDKAETNINVKPQVEVVEKKATEGFWSRFRTNQSDKAKTKAAKAEKGAAEEEKEAAQAEEQKDKAEEGFFKKLAQGKSGSDGGGGEKQESNKVVPLFLVLIGLAHWALKVFVFNGQSNTILFLTSFVLFVLAGFALSGSLEKNRLTIFLPMIAFMVWYLGFEGNYSPGFLMTFIPVVVAILIGVGFLTKGESAKPELLGLLPVLFFFLDLGLIPWLIENFNWSITEWVRSLIIWTPWWFYFGIFTAPSKGKIGGLLTFLKVVGVVYAIFLLAAPSFDFGHAAQTLPSFGELSESQARIMENIPKGENKAYSRFVCLFEEPTDVEGCFERRQEDALLVAICEEEEQVNSRIITMSECKEREKEKLKREQIQVSGVEDKTIKEPTTAEFKISDYFPKTIYRQAGEEVKTKYPAEFKFENPRKQGVEITFSCHFINSDDEEIVGITTPAEPVVITEGERAVLTTTVTCEAEENLEGSYTLVYQANLEELQTKSRLARVFIGEKDFNWKEKWLPEIKQAHFPGNEHLSKAPNEFAAISFAFGKTLEDPIIEASDVLFLAANVEHKCEELTINHYKIDLEGLDSFAEPQSCLEGWEVIGQENEEIVYLPTCTFSRMPGELENVDEGYIYKEFIAELDYDCLYERTIRNVKVEVIGTEPEEEVS
ncbi:MAG: hypothetical protein KKH52_01940 [Nanoarchaeota archaeon]|nr:hypothetical protein [Nanoarchaeota archaeon]MBU1622309.1 hypothetical protein [Nanoarchaeota archaeon]MBU1974132.1 hypothetical protein [Nanoarchaeota archaeon]